MTWKGVHNIISTKARLQKCAVYVTIFLEDSVLCIKSLEKVNTYIKDKSFLATSGLWDSFDFLFFHVFLHSLNFK